MTRYTNLALRYLLSLSLAGLVIWLLFKDIDRDTLLDTLKDVNIGWASLGFFLSILAFYLRAYRWQLLLRTANISLPYSQGFLIVMSGYLVNFLLPRMGELFRCILLKRNYHIPITQSLGSVLAEKVLDITCLLIFLCWSLLFAQELLLEVLEESFVRTQQLAAQTLYIFIIFGVACLTLCLYLLKRYKQRVRQLWKKFSTHLTALKHVRPLHYFHGSTILLWGLYYLSNYAFMQSYPSSAALPLSTGIVLLATSSLGMAMPVQGGVGTLHAALTATFLWYGLDKSLALALPIIIHFSHTVATFGFGSVGLYIMFYKRKSL